MNLDIALEKNRFQQKAIERRRASMQQLSTRSKQEKYQVTNPYYEQWKKSNTQSIGDSPHSYVNSPSRQMPRIPQVQPVKLIDDIKQRFSNI